MGITRGRKYPGVSDGLIFCFDPKNRDCWSGGSTSFTDLVNGEALTGNNNKHNSFVSMLKVLQKLSNL